MSLRPAVVVLALGAVLAAGCHGASADPPSTDASPTSTPTSPTSPTAPAAPAAPAVRVTATVADPMGGAEPVFDIEVLRTPAGVHATLDTPLGRYAEELETGDRYFVRMPDAAVVLGTDDWILVDRSKPDEAELAEIVRLGILSLAGVADLEVGDEVLDAPIRRIERDGERWVLGLDDRTELVVTRTELSAAPVLPVPDADSYVPISVVRERAVSGRG